MNEKLDLRLFLMRQNLEFSNTRFLRKLTEQFETERVESKQNNVKFHDYHDYDIIETFKSFESSR